MKTQHSNGTRVLLLLSLAILTIGSPVMQGANTLQFAPGSYAISESVDFFTARVERLDASDTAVAVDYTTADGTALSGVKYTAVSGTLAFEPGETNKLIRVPLLHESVSAGAKSFQIVLRNPTSGAILGARSTATVSIIDNDLGIQFQFGTYLVPENAESVEIGVRRGDDGNFPVTVAYATSDMTASSGLDYKTVTNTLSFAAGEKLKRFTVPILNDPLKEANETVRITLSNPTGGAVLSFQKTATIVIRDNDQGFRFELASFSVGEDAGMLRLAVLRDTDDTTGLATVDFNTTDATAVSGLDYTGKTNTISFAPGARVAVITVPILNEPFLERRNPDRIHVRR